MVVCLLPALGLNTHNWTLTDCAGINEWMTRIERMEEKMADKGYMASGTHFFLSSVLTKPCICLFWLFASSAQFNILVPLFLSLLCVLAVNFDGLPTCPVLSSFFTRLHSAWLVLHLDFYSVRVALWEKSKCSRPATTFGCLRPLRTDRSSTTIPGQAIPPGPFQHRPLAEERRPNQDPWCSTILIERLLLLRLHRVSLACMPFFSWGLELEQERGGSKKAARNNRAFWGDSLSLDLCLHSFFVSFLWSMCTYVFFLCAWESVRVEGLFFILYLCLLVPVLFVPVMMWWRKS